MAVLTKCSLFDMDMAAAANADFFADVWPDAEQLTSENGIFMGRDELGELIYGIFMGRDELGELILDRIRRIQRNNHQADYNLV